MAYPEKNLLVLANKSRFGTREGASSVVFMFRTIQIEDGKKDKLVDK